MYQYEALIYKHSLVFRSCEENNSIKFTILELDGQKDRLIINKVPKCLLRLFPFIISNNN